PSVASYRWEGAIQEDSDVVLSAKTRRERVDELSARVAASHSSDCPCVVALPIEGGHAPFLEWIGAETRT
ncbi:MAG: divalent-cation tolerance protein CutA, partial [Pseudomonadota bacterium]|nr:divalent-cation tolerance protein CutA [Pseudomonadota bacterium]